MATPVAAWLAEAASAHPALAEKVSALGELHDKKLWHELTLEVEAFVASPEAKAAKGMLLGMYNRFLSDFQDRINPLKLAQVAVAVSGEHATRPEAVGFLDGVTAKLAEHKEPTEESALYVRMHVALLRLHEGEAGACKQLVEEGSASLDKLASPDPAVSASVHFAAAQLAKSKQDFAAFYRSALLYLAYTQAESLPPATQLELATDLSLAALLGENVYNFGELLAHPLLQSLVGTSFEWLKRVLEVFHAGDLHAYDELCMAYADQLNAQPALVANERKLREKITILALMEIIFQLPSEDRVISLEQIAERTKLPLDGVEFLLMKTLSVHLIEGIIDQVAGTVRVSWVQPRVLLVPQIQELRSRLDGWTEKVATAVASFESESSPEIMAAA